MKKANNKANQENNVKNAKNAGNSSPKNCGKSGCNKHSSNAQDRG